MNQLPIQGNSSGMKIAYLHGATIPSRAASTIQVMRMCEAIAGLGHEVMLLAPNKPDAERGVNDIYDHYGVAHSFKIYEIPPINSLPRVTYN